MTRKRRKRDRVYWRNRAGVNRAWGDFRDYVDVGGGREPLVADGERIATTDPDVAQMLAAARVRELDAHRRGRALHGCVKSTPLAAYAAEHLVKKARAGKVTRDWLDVTAVYLKRASDWFGADRELVSITVEDVQGWATHLATAKFVRRSPKTKPETPGRSLSSGTVRHALNALSNVYRRAQSEGRVAPGFNPVASLMDKPVGVKRESRWLEVPEAALLLESARTLSPAIPQLKQLQTEIAHALLATFLLTGGRRAEVLGLEVDDISFDRQTVTFRPNTFRRLKTLRSARVVPLMPQLAEILQRYVFRQPPTRLLFPAFVNAQEALLGDWRGTLDRIAERAGWKRGEIRSRMFRHTYCAARLQTLDGGAPISPFTVSRELGHGSGAMVDQVYSHLGTIRHRSEVVEYRLEQHAKALHDRLEAIGWETPTETAASP